MPDSVIFPLKAPVAILDYQLDWTDWLQAGESLTTCTVTADVGITVGSNPAPVIVGKAVVWWLLDGVIGQSYDVVVVITTNQGRKDQRTCGIEAGKK